MDSFQPLIDHISKKISTTENETMERRFFASQEQYFLRSIFLYYGKFFKANSAISFTTCVGELQSQLLNPRT